MDFPEWRLRLLSGTFQKAKFCNTASCTFLLSVGVQKIQETERQTDSASVLFPCYFILHNGQTPIIPSPDIWGKSKFYLIHTVGFECNLCTCQNSVPFFWNASLSHKIKIYPYFVRCFGFLPLCSPEKPQLPLPSAKGSYISQYLSQLAGLCSQIRIIMLKFVILQLYFTY